MKKHLMATIAIAIATTLLLVACGGTVDSSPSSIVAPDSSASELSPAVESPIHADMYFEDAQIQAVFEDVLHACEKVTKIVVSKGDLLPTLDDYLSIANEIGSLGYPVYHHALDMPNYEKVEEFLDNVQSKDDTKIIIFCLSNWTIRADILVCNNGDVYRKSIYYDYLHGGEIDYPELVEKLERIRFTEQGYFLYDIPARDGFEKEYSGYRVTPLGAENRSLGQKFVSGIGYYPNEMLRCNWDSNDFSGLSLEWVFESLYVKFNGKYPFEDYSQTDSEGHTLIPATAVEGLMLQHLPFTTGQLQTTIPYSKETGYYMHRPYAGGGYSPVSEIVEVTENKDDSLTLKVNAVAVEFGSDASMTSLLTVTTSLDGSIRYISNKVIVPFE